MFIDPPTKFSTNINIHENGSNYLIVNERCRVFEFGHKCNSFIYRSAKSKEPLEQFEERTVAETQKITVDSPFASQ